MHSKRIFPNKYCAYLLFLLAILFAVVSVYYAAVRLPMDNIHLERTQSIVYSDNWSVQTAHGLLPLSEPSRPAADCINGTLQLVNSLPASLPGGMTLCFQTKNEIVRVMIDDTLIYTYGQQPPLAYGHGVGAVWNLVSLPADSAGKTVSITLTPVDTRTGLAPYDFLLGSKGDIRSFLLQQKWGIGAISILLTIIGLGALIASAVGRLRKRSWASSFFFFALFVLLATVWMVTDSGLLQFLIGNKAVIYLLFGCSFYLLCIPLTLFMSIVLPESKKLFEALSIIGSFYALLRIILYITGLVNFETMLWLLHVLMGILLLTCNLTLWLPVLRGKTLPRMDLYWAVSAFSIIEGISLVSFYVNDKLDMQRNGYASGFYIGILLFVLIIVIGAVQKLRILRQQAFKADFFEKRAYTDDLTQLLNVKGFDDKCEELLQNTSSEMCYVVVDFDVNYFSQYNANNGVAAGDTLLLEIASGLKQFCSSNELCARQESDHFVCLLRGSTLDSILNRIRNADLAVRHRLAAQMLLFSYGVVEITDRGLSITALRNQALVAKRTVKGNYERNIAVYDRRLHELQLREMALLSSFEAALENKEYVIFLQPKIDTATEELGGAEALVRRVEPDGAIVSPGMIIEALERKGFVTKLDYYTLELICNFQSRCRSAGLPVCTISNNFSRVHLYDPTFPSKVAEIVDRYGLPHHLIEVELTESVFLVGKDILQRTSSQLHSYGFSVSIDDFGSGYSSLNMLKDVHVDTIKLDREFLSDFTENTRGRTIIEHTLRLAQELHISTVAEGIETAQQLAFLRGLGCELVQGYYYSRPLPEEAFIAKYLSQ